jgi:RNA polymerase sigma-70 factor (ECF subfamily)
MKKMSEKGLVLKWSGAGAGASRGQTSETRVQSSECRAEGPEDDAELVVRAQEGETGAFDELVLRHSRPLYCYVWRMCRNQAEAEELVQQTFVKAWEGLGGFRAEASFRTWLFRIGTNQCLNRLARRRTHVPLDESLAGPARDEPDQIRARRVQSERVQAALLSLPLDQRAALLLYAHDELSYDEIAAVMGRSTAAVNALIYRARVAVRVAMGAAR